MGRKPNLHIIIKEQLYQLSCNAGTDEGTNPGLALGLQYAVVNIP